MPIGKKYTSQYALHCAKMMATTQQTWLIIYSKITTSNPKA